MNGRGGGRGRSAIFVLSDCIFSLASGGRGLLIFLWFLGSGQATGWPGGAVEGRGDCAIPHNMSF